MRHRTVAVVALAVALVAVPAARQQAVSVAGTCSYGASECDVAYVDGAHTRRTLDVFYARGAKTAASSRPAVLFVHGGGWWGGDKTDLASPSFNAPLEAAAHGWVAFNVNYRLGDDPNHPGRGDTAVPYRDEPADVAAAVAWVRAHASRYSVDVDRVAIVGASAGGHLALLTAYRVPGVRAVVTWGGPTNLASLGVVYPCATTSATAGACAAGTYPVPSEMVRRYTTCTASECPYRYRVASPVAYVRPGVPATLQIRGDFDVTVPAEQSAELDRLLTDAGVVSVVHDCVVSRGARAFPCTHDTMAREVWAPTQAFLDSNL